MQWETVIGLEVHVQLKTKSKLFSGAATTFGSEPNAQACAIDLALPGVLPVLNQQAVQLAIKFGQAIHAEIAKKSIFARKNYFYPDLPKGYQISQFELPIVGAGYLDIFLDADHRKRIGITRAHLEEDAGKSLHEDFQGMSGIDLNRAGVPLLEIVSAPDMRSAQEAIAYLKTLHTLIRYLDISDANLQEGSFRCDANVSIRKKGETKLGTRTEIKNLNSFRFIDRAIDFEVMRQIHLIENGQPVVQETRLYDADKNETRSMRDKEEAFDYRYFPDPDLLPLTIDEATLEQIKQTLPELPQEKLARFQEDYQLNRQDALILTSDIDLAHYFEAVVEHNGGQLQPHTKLVANWMLTELLALLNKTHLTLSESPISAARLAELIQRIADQTISGKIAKTIFATMWTSDARADAIIAEQGLEQMTDGDAIEKIVEAVIANLPNQLAQYRNGKEKLFGFFVGQVMKATQGKANPQQVNAWLHQKLQS